MSRSSKYLKFQFEEIDAETFEDLCGDLLKANEYPSVEQMGGSNDGGRDAQVRLGSNEFIFFAFSTQQTWENKLREDAKKS